MAKQPGNPIGSDIRRLPRWARVALAARCAARVLPLVLSDLSERASLAAAMRLAVDVSNDRARRGGGSRPVPELTATVNEAIEYLRREGSEEAQFAAESVRDALFETAGAIFDTPALYEATGNGKMAPLDTAEMAWHLSWEAADCHSQDAEGRVVPASITDLGRLLALAKIENWTNDTPVDPDSLGPLWPEGPPANWLTVSDSDDYVKGLALVIEVPDNASDAEIEEKTATLVGRLDTLYRALGGPGLVVIPPTDANVPANVMTGVGS